MYLAKSVCPGIVICDAFVLQKKTLEFAPQTNSSKLTPKEEIQRYRNALKQFERNTHALIKKANMSYEQALILEQHITMVHDPQVSKSVLWQIETESATCETAVTNTFDKLSQMFLQGENELTKARATDLTDIKIRLVEILMGKLNTSLEHINAPCILIAHELTPSEMMRIERTKVKGIITESGTTNSHMAIMARAMGIPTAVGVHGLFDALKCGDVVAMNVASTHAEIIISPSKEDIARLNALTETKTKDNLEKNITPGAEPKIHVYANISTHKDLDNALLSNADGIGLFRSELLFMGKDTAPSEQEQFETYKKAAQKFPDKQVTIRTLDIGADKHAAYLETKAETNPALGLRGIRMHLTNTELFKTQLRAILRASAYGNVRIMLPMITTQNELRETKTLIEETKSELTQQNISFDKNILIGIMIETPSAAIIADILAEECDFFSIGTNDLTQYIMSADRLSETLESLLSAYQPAVMRMVYNIIKAGKNAGIKVCICGEAAAERRMLSFLLGCGLDEFSVSVHAVKDVRQIISELPTDNLTAAVQTVLTMGTKEEIIDYLGRIK